MQILWGNGICMIIVSVAHTASHSLYSHAEQSVEWLSWDGCHIVADPPSCCRRYCGSMFSKRDEENNRETKSEHTAALLSGPDCVLCAFQAIYTLALWIYSKQCPNTVTLNASSLFSWTCRFLWCDQLRVHLSDVRHFPRVFQDCSPFVSYVALSLLQFVWVILKVVIHLPLTLYLHITFNFQLLC